MSVRVIIHDLPTVQTESPITTDRSAFGPDTATNEVLDGTDLSGWAVLITGGTSGLGEESARVMAAHGATVIITARNMEKGQGVADKIARQTGKTVTVEEPELGSTASIHAFADHILARDGKLDVVITNAGVMACPPMTTDDGFELQFGSSHLGHFLAVNLIVGALAEGARTVSLSSSSHQISPVVFDDIQFENREYNRWAAYGKAKTANALFAVALDSRLRDRGIEAFTVHPGGIMTELARHMPEEDLKMFQDRIGSGDLKLKTVEQGAATQVLAATAPELAGKGGSFLADCSICSIDDEADMQTVVRSYTNDPSLAEQLWAVSEDMLGVSFDI